MFRLTEACPAKKLNLAQLLPRCDVIWQHTVLANKNMWVYLGLFYQIQNTALLPKWFGVIIVHVMYQTFTYLSSEFSVIWDDSWSSRFRQFLADSHTFFCRSPLCWRCCNTAEVSLKTNKVALAYSAVSLNTALRLGACTLMSFTCYRGGAEQWLLHPVTPTPLQNTHLSHSV